MDIKSAPFYLAGQRPRDLGVALLLVALAIVGFGFIVGIAVTSLAAASEPATLAPLRWG